MGNKRRILRNPKFAYLKKSWFNKEDKKEEQVSNTEAQEQLKAQPQEMEVQTPILDAVQDEQEVVEAVEAAPVEEVVEPAEPEPTAEKTQTKPKMTIKKSPPKKKVTTRKPRTRKTTAKRKSTKSKVS
jgi:hypothetical protein